MPFKSKAQAAFLKHHAPAIYREFARDTTKGTKLPGHVKGAKKGK